MSDQSIDERWNKNESNNITHKLDLKIVSIDYYMSKPNPTYDNSFSTWRNQPCHQVPVIRIFGPAQILSKNQAEDDEKTTINHSTRSFHGSLRKTTLHLHGVYPYFMLPIPRNAAPDASYHIASEIDRALNNSINAKFRKDGNKSKFELKSRHVFKIEKVYGSPFYGFYHVKSDDGKEAPKQWFYKIYLYNPSYVSKVCQLIFNGDVLKGIWHCESGSNNLPSLQPHESHIPYILQFMIDFDLYGMHSVKFSEFHVRGRSLFSVDQMSPQYVPHGSRGVNSFEIDGVSTDIIVASSSPNCSANSSPSQAQNRNDSKLKKKFESLLSSRMHNPGLCELWHEEFQRRLQQHSTSTIFNNAESSSTPWMCSDAEFSRKTDAFDDMFSLLEKDERSNDIEDKLNESKDKSSVQTSFSSPSEMFWLDVLKSKLDTINIRDENDMDASEDVVEDGMTRRCATRVIHHVSSLVGVRNTVNDSSKQFSMENDEIEDLSDIDDDTHEHDIGLDETDSELVDLLLADTVYGPSQRSNCLKTPFTDTHYQKSGVLNCSGRGEEEREDYDIFLSDDDELTSLEMSQVFQPSDGGEEKVTQEESVKCFKRSNLDTEEVINDIIDDSDLEDIFNSTFA